MEIKTITGATATIEMTDWYLYGQTLENGVECNVITLRDGLRVVYDPTENQQAQQEVEQHLISCFPELLG